VVNHDELTELAEYWGPADDHLLREYQVTGRLTAPAHFIVHSLTDVNDQLKHGRPFFLHILNDGIVLYEAPDHPFETPKKLSAKETLAEAQDNYDQWLESADNALLGARFYIEQEKTKDAAFLLHQATERLYHGVALVLTLYSPKSHKLNFLRSQAERLVPSLIEAWPRDMRFQQRSWELLRRAYVEARYSKHYKISAEELAWLSERVAVLADLVRRACDDRLAALRAAANPQD